MNKNTMATLAIILGSILLVGSSVGLVSEVYGSTGSFERTTVFVVDNVGVNVHDLNLKATESEDGEIDTVSDFEIDPEDVVQVRQGGNIMVFTGAEDQKIDKVKVTSAQGLTTELVGVKNSYSVQALATGVYTLSIIVDTGDEKEAFQTILVVLGANESPINPITIVNNFENVIKTRTIIEFNDDDDDNDNDNGNETNPKPKPKPTPPKGNDTELPTKCQGLPTDEKGQCVSEGEGPVELPTCDENAPDVIPCRDDDGELVNPIDDNPEPVINEGTEEEEQNLEVIDEEEQEEEEESEEIVEEETDEEDGSTEVEEVGGD